MSIISVGECRGHPIPYQAWHYAPAMCITWHEAHKARAHAIPRLPTPRARRSCRGVSFGRACATSAYPCQEGRRVQLDSGLTSAPAASPEHIWAHIGRTSATWHMHYSLHSLHSLHSPTQPAEAHQQLWPVGCWHMRIAPSLKHAMAAHCRDACEASQPASCMRPCQAADHRCPY